MYDADQSSCTYAIVRPGGLEESSDVVGAAGLEVSQGDALAGVVSRPDLAAFTVKLARSEALTFDTALEIYTTQSAQPCEGRFKPLLARRTCSASARRQLARAARGHSSRRRVLCAVVMVPERLARGCMSDTHTHK